VNNFLHEEYLNMIIYAFGNILYHAVYLSDILSNGELWPLKGTRWDLLESMFPSWSQEISLLGPTFSTRLLYRSLFKLYFLSFHNEFTIYLWSFCEQEQANLMWNSMDEEVQKTYGKKYFDQKASTDSTVHALKNLDRSIMHVKAVLSRGSSV
jgi:hypothetical protein